MLDATTTTSQNIRAGSKGERRRTLKLVDGGGEKTSHVVADIKETLLSFSLLGWGEASEDDGFAGFSALAAARALATVSCHCLSVATAAIFFASLFLCLKDSSRHSSTFVL